MPPSPNKLGNPERVHRLGFNLSREPVMAQENEHIETLVTARDRELEHRRDVAKASAEAIDRALADEERLASVIFVSHPIAHAIRFPTSAARSLTGSAASAGKSRHS
jgi:hypothetical protein